jgi:two-component system, response regulator YesN
MYKILIADDVAEICNGLSNYFPWYEFGFEVVGQAENGVQALNFIEKNPVDVLLCDIMMPVMDGIKLAKELFDRNSPIKIVFISAYKEFEYAKKALAYGVMDYLVKPTKYSELAELCFKIKAELDKRGFENKENGLKNQTEIDMKGYNYQEQIIATVKKYISEHLCEATLEEAGKLVHMNPYYLSKFFKDKTGEKFSDYLIMIRMKKAAELLKNITYRTYQVSEMVGYSSPKNFARTFKNFFGKTPKEYRNYTGSVNETNGLEDERPSR